MITEVDDSNIASAAQIHSESWRDSHKSFCSASFIRLHTAAHQEAYLRREMQAGKRLYMLVEGSPVGIVTVCDNLIENLYILPCEQHKGYGKKLMMFALRQCAGPPELWCLDNNQKAYALYYKLGFRKTGKRHILSDSLSEIEMRLEKFF